MSKPDKPKTPESEKIVTRHQAKLGKKGTALASRVGNKFVANINRDRTTEKRRTSSADVALSQRRANAQVSSDPVKIAMNASRGSAATAKNMVSASTGGVSERTQRQSAGNSAALNISQSVTRAGLHIAKNQTARGIDKMNREFKRANELVDAAGAVAGGAMHAYNSSNATGVMSNPNGSPTGGGSDFNFFDQIDPNDPFSTLNGGGGPAQMYS